MTQGPDPRDLPGNGRITLVWKVTRHVFPLGVQALSVNLNRALDPEVERMYFTFWDDIGSGTLVTGSVKSGIPVQHRKYGPVFQERRTPIQSGDFGFIGWGFFPFTDPPPPRWMAVGWEAVPGPDRFARAISPLFQWERAPALYYDVPIPPWP